jgi:GntR family transcriptional regulator
MLGDEARRVANALREGIESGRYPAGSKLPAGEKLAESFGVHRGTAMSAVRRLADEGLVDLVRRQAARVRDRPRARLAIRERVAYRDEAGYFFSQNAKDWIATEPPTRGLNVPPDHVSDLLGVPRGQDVLVRDRKMGPTDTRQVLQLATSYLPMALVAELPVLGAEKSGPGGIYDRLEGHFQAPLEWEETAWSRSPTDEEQVALKISKAIPVFVVTRVAMIMRDGELIAAEVNETRMSSERFALSYRVQRDSSAAWPRQA